MNDLENKYVMNRAETLAREFLTRRPEVVIHSFDYDDLDFVATLYPSASLKIQGFSPFGVVVWGTSRPISSEAAASSFAGRRWKTEAERSPDQRKFFFPVIALVYAVREDIGYYAWISEPNSAADSRPKLIPNEYLHCTKIGRNSLDDIVERVAEWYTRLASVILSA
jgi:hypothetical protein